MSDVELWATDGCNCGNCDVYAHKSDCAVHNEPAYRNGSCSCGAKMEHFRRLARELQ